MINAYGPRTRFVGAHPYPPTPPKPPKPVKLPKPVKPVAVKKTSGFSYVLAVRSKPGISTSELTKQAGCLRRYALRALKLLASKGVVHCVKRPGCGLERFWYPGTP